MLGTIVTQRIYTSTDGEDARDGEKGSGQGRVNGSNANDVADKVFERIRKLRARCP